MMTGANSRQESREHVEQITFELKKAGFNLREWISNVSEIVEELESTEENKNWRSEKMNQSKLWGD